ncbi:MAG: hypothetical protein WAM41_08695 [Psychrobacillus psychrotolerans]
MSKEKGLGKELEEAEEKIQRNEQTLANFIIVAFIWMVTYKIMTGTF